jgi:uncharacterized protein (DUF2141 family)
MRIIRIFTICLLLSPLAFLTAQSTLTIEITGLENNKGRVIVALLDKNKEDVADQSSVIINNQCSVSFKNLKHGRYAFQYFHDENENIELDTNILGIPKEGFGFSNDAMGKFGPKDFSEWLFDFSGDTLLKMKIQYML